MDARRLNSAVILNAHLRYILRHISEVTLRLPGVLLLEIWWRNKDVYVTPEALKNSPFSSYLDMNNIIQFIQTRNFDQSAATILSYAVVFLFSIFLSLPLKKLLWIYAHFISLFLLGVANHLSVRYVRIEQNEDPDLRLDDVKKLEWHGSHILAQLMLCIAQSCLLGLESDFERAMLSVFLIPILLRMSGLSLGRLMLAHNLACSLAMLSVFIYFLNQAPKLLNSMRQSYFALRNVVASRGFIEGTVTVWHDLYFGEILSCAWVLIFIIQVYVNLHSKPEKLAKTSILVLSAIAECTSTPLSLLALALTVRYACSFIINLSRWVVGGNHESNHFLVHSGYAEVLVLVLLCSQTGFLTMPLEQKAFLLGLMLLIVMSSLLQSLYELLEPRLLELAATPVLLFKRHLCSLILVAVLFASSIIMAVVITIYLPFDLWCVITASDSVLTALRTLSITVVYALIVVETQIPEFWEVCDGVIFYIKIGTHTLELGFATFIVVYGISSFFEEHWSLVSSLVLIFHTYFNIWQRVQKILSSLRIRQAAVRNMLRLPRASPILLAKKKDMCAICCEEMRFEARITPCKHFFHGACLKKWLIVKQVCPLCYSVVSFENERDDVLDSGDRSARNPISLFAFSTVSFDSEEDSSEWDSDSSSSDFFEYTVVTTHNTDSSLSTVPDEL